MTPKRKDVVLSLEQSNDPPLFEESPSRGGKKREARNPEVKEKHQPRLPRLFILGTILMRSTLERRKQWLRYYPLWKRKEGIRPYKRVAYNYLEAR